MVHSLIKIFLLLMDIAAPLAYMCFLVIAVRASLGVATFELIINFAEVREGSYPNEPHLRALPHTTMVPRSRRVPPFVLVPLGTL